MEKISSDTIGKLKAEHGRIDTLEVGEGEDAIELALKVPPEMEWNRYLAELRADGANRHEVQARFVSRFVVHPGPVELQALLDRMPGLVETVAPEISEMAGLGLVTKRKKA